MVGFQIPEYQSVVKPFSLDHNFGDKGLFNLINVEYVFKDESYIDEEQLVFLMLKRCQKLVVPLWKENHVTLDLVASIPAINLAIAPTLRVYADPIHAGELGI